MSTLLAEPISPELVLVSPELRELAFAIQRDVRPAAAEVVPALEASKPVATRVGSVPAPITISWFDLFGDPDPEPDPQVSLAFGIAVYAASRAAKTALYGVTYAGVVALFALVAGLA